MQSRTPSLLHDKLKREGRCFNCHGKGHLSRDCRQKKQSMELNAIGAPTQHGKQA